MPARKSSGEKKPGFSKKAGLLEHQFCGAPLAENPIFGFRRTFTAVFLDLRKHADHAGDVDQADGPAGG